MLLGAAPDGAAPALSQSNHNEYGDTCMVQMNTMDPQATQMYVDLGMAPTTDSQATQKQNYADMGDTSRKRRRTSASPEVAGKTVDAGA